MRTILQAALLILLTAVGLAQDTLRTTTTLVVVPTLVQTPAKDIVYTLTADDFTLTDNGAPQKIKLEPASTQPLSLVVLVQIGGAAQRQFRYYNHLETMLASLLENGPDSGHAPNQVAVVNFDSRPEAASPFTTDVSEWTGAINQPFPGNSGAAILDGLAYSLRLLKAQPANNRRAILLISQPTDSGSKTTLKEILRTTAETNTAIYTLTFSPEKTAIKQALNDPHGNAPLNTGNGTYVAYFDFSMPVALLLSTMQTNLAANIATITGGEAADLQQPELARQRPRHPLHPHPQPLSPHLPARLTQTRPAQARSPAPATL